MSKRTVARNATFSGGAASSKSVRDQSNILPSRMGGLLSWNLRALFTLLVLASLGMLFYLQHERILNSLGVGSSKWKDMDFLAEDIPLEVQDFLKDDKNVIRIDERTAEIQGVKVFYRETSPGPVLPSSGKAILLLHGQAFTSKTWEEQVPTMQTLAALGHRAVAIDLPGYGNTPLVSVEPDKFLSAVISKLFSNQSPIVVSPSMSGTFSLEVLMKRPDLLCGFVPVAPVLTDKYSRDEYLSVQTPTLIVVGEKDTGIGRTSKQHLSQIPTATAPQVIPNARHPCYLDDHQRWHTLLYNFIKALNC